VRVFVTSPWRASDADVRAANLQRALASEITGDLDHAVTLIRCLQRSGGSGYPAAPGPAARAERRIEAVRLSPAVYDAPPEEAALPAPPPARPVYGPPLFALLDLPLLSETEAPGAPWLAAYAAPWPGRLALYRDGAGAPVLAATATARSPLGRLETALAPGPSGRWLAMSVRLRLYHGALVSRSAEAVLAGDNALAVRSLAGGWEILQFRDAVLESDGIWRLSTLLRGQAGTEAEAAAGAAENALAVLVTPALVQAGAPADLRGLEMDWRAGPADEPPEGDSYAALSVAYAARNLQPLSPVHLTARPLAGGGWRLGWIRRGRIGADAWTGEDIPLGEAYERYRVSIYSGASLLREAETTAPGFDYLPAMVEADFGPGGPQGPFTVEVRQVSDAVGPGAPARVDVG